MRLSLRDDEYVIHVSGGILMSSRMHGSEEALATVACQRVQTAERPRVLVGGLGMGFTLRATLDLLPPGAVVTVAELVHAVVEWNRGPLAPLAGRPLDDPRVRVKAGEDVGFTLRENRESSMRSCSMSTTVQRRLQKWPITGSTPTLEWRPRTRRSGSGGRSPCGRLGRTENSSNGYASTDSFRKLSACGAVSRRAAAGTPSSWD